MGVCWLRSSVVAVIRRFYGFSGQSMFAATSLAPCCEAFAKTVTGGNGASRCFGVMPPRGPNAACMVPLIDRLVDRCEVVLYSPVHDAALWELPHDQVVSLIGLWAERFDALAARRVGYAPALFGYTDQSADPTVVPKGER